MLECINLCWCKEWIVYNKDFIGKFCDFDRDKFVPSFFKININLFLCLLLYTYIIDKIIFHSEYFNLSKIKIFLIHI